MAICCISFHPCRSIRKQIWPSHKNGHGQPSVIIWTNLVVLEYPMLYSKFKGHWLLDSEGGDMWMFLPYMGLEAILIMWPGIFKQISSQHIMKASYEIWLQTALRLVGKEVWQWWIWVTLDKGQWMTLTLRCHKSSFTYLFDFLYQISPYRLR